MKKLICLLLSLISLFAFAMPAFAEQSEVTMPYYTNATTVSTELQISNTGVATVNVYCVGKVGTTSINVTYYLEKQNGSSWSRVDIGTTNDQWTHTVSTRVLSQTKTAQLYSSGTYRVTAVFKVTISSLTETITATDMATF